MMQRKLNCMPVMTLFWALAIGLLFNGTAIAQVKKAAAKPAATKSAGAKPKSSWLVQCTDAGGGLRCKASQSLIVAKTRQHILTVTVQRDASNNMSALYHTGFGLFLPAGIKVGVDNGKSKTLPFQTCSAKGCYAATVLTAEQVSNMRKGKVLKAVVQNLKKKPITLNIRLQGFGEAYNKIK